MRYKLAGIIALVMIGILTLSVPVMAFTYYVNIQVQETGGNAYTNYPYITEINNTYLATNYYIKATGLDTRVLSGSAEIPHLVTDNKTLFVAPSMPAYSTGNFKYTFGNDALTSMPIIVGNGGYVTIVDAPALEGGSNFKFEFDGYINIGIITSNTSSTASGKSHIINLPSGTQTGDLIIVMVSNYGTSADITWGAGLISLDKQVNSAQVSAGVAYFIADGGETTSSFTTGGSCASAHHAFRVPAGSYTGIPAISANAYFYGSQYPNPTAVTPSWGATDDSLVFAFIGGVSAAPSVYPYTTAQQSTIEGSAHAASCSTLGKAASFDPGAFNVQAANFWGWAWAVAIERPTYIICKSASIFTGIDYNGELFTTIQGGATVITSGITDGEHKVEVYIDGTDLKIEVDDVLEDTEALGGVGIPDTANNWMLMGNAIPYLNYYKHTVGGTLITWYQPVSIISGTTLPDREGAAQNGVITWGANPAGLAETISSLVSYNQPTPVAAEGVTEQDVLPGSSTTDWYTESVLTSNIFHPIVGVMAQYTHFSETQIWITVASFIILIVMVIAYIFLKHLLYAVIVGVVFDAFFVAYLHNVYPWWTLVIFGFIGFATVVWERKSQI